MNHFNIANPSPFKWVKNGIISIHFGDMWACEQIRDNQRKVYYRQKWQTSDTTYIQMESSIAPNDLQLRNFYNGVVKTFVWTSAFDAGTYKIYETQFDTSDVSDGVYFLYQKVELGGIKWEALTEPIQIAPSWPHTLFYRYWNTFNKDGVAWTTGVKFGFRCESDIQDWEPDTDRVNYRNQIKSNELLDGVASDQFQLYVAEAPGVAEYIVWKLDRIFVCNKVFINDKQYSAKPGSQIKITRNRSYSLIGASLDIVPATNSNALEFADTTPLFGGIITSYNIETGFFGPAATVPVLEVEENG